MRKFPLFILFLLIFSSFSVRENTATLTPTFVSSVNTLENTPTPMDRLAKMKIKEAEKILGRKLTLKEKIAFKIAQLKIKKGLKAKAEGTPSKGQTAFILSLIGLCLLIVPYAGIASLPLAIIGLVMGSKAKKENPDDNKAKTAIILSLVTLGLIVLAVLLVIAIIASGGFWVY
ncbi:MAG: hypothetical protein ABUT20_15495 [Bacteroidota bacterium]